MVKDLQAAFDKFDDEYLEFNKVKGERRLHNRPDICAFLLLDKLVPGKDDMVSAAEHDEFFLDVSPGKLAKVASEEDIQTLVRCGVRYSSQYESLCMFA